MDDIGLTLVFNEFVLANATSVQTVVAGLARFVEGSWRSWSSKKREALVGFTFATLRGGVEELVSEE